MKKTIVILIVIIIVIVVAFVGYFKFSGSDDKSISEIEEKIAIPTTEAEKQAWSMFRDYVVSTTEITEKYFDDHFFFASLRQNTSLPGEWNSATETSQRFFEGMDSLEYIVKVDIGRTNYDYLRHPYKAGIYNGKFLEKSDRPNELTSYERGYMENSIFEISGIKTMDKVSLAKDKAKEIMKKGECGQNEWFQDVDQQEMELFFYQDVYHWNWQTEKQGCESSCWMNTETRAIQMFEGNCPD